MAKKKTGKRTVRKKDPAQKKTSNKSHASSIEKKLDLILANQKRLLSEEQKIEKEEEILETEEEKNETGESEENKELKTIESELKSKEKEEEAELSKLQSLESEIKREVGEHPLRKITFKDVIKGLVGAFIGLAVHYTFTYGVEISEGLTVTRSTFLFIFSFIIGILFIYATGFRKIKDPKILMFMPVRFIVLYIDAIIMSIIVLLIFYPHFGEGFTESYKMVAGVLLAAVVGACTADLIGKE